MKKLIFLFSFILSLPCLGQKLKEGDNAPYFTVNDIYGNKVVIPSKSKTLLAFMRYAGCPICNFRMHQLIENHNNLVSNGFQLIVIYQSSDPTLREYLKDENLSITVVGDPNRKLYKKYGVEPSFWKTLGSAFKKNTYKHKKEGGKLFGSSRPKRDGNITGIPADFIISENGSIIKAYYGKTISDHLPLKDIIQ
tara:strand:+ start:15720 stop:16301 length:582 start_codon:yes stop_codon:yes gene_type:complete